MHENTLNSFLFENFLLFLLQPIFNHLNFKRMKSNAEKIKKAEEKRRRFYSQKYLGKKTYTPEKLIRIVASRDEALAGHDPSAVSDELYEKYYFELKTKGHTTRKRLVKMIMDRDQKLLDKEAERLAASGSKHAIKSRPESRPSKRHKLISLGELAAALGVDDQSIRNYADRGIIKTVKIGVRRYVDRETFENAFSDASDLKKAKAAWKKFRAEFERKYAERMEMIRITAENGSLFAQILNVPLNARLMRQFVRAVAPFAGNEKLVADDVENVMSFMNGEKIKWVAKNRGVSVPGIRNSVKRVIAAAENAPSYFAALEKIERLEKENSVLKEENASLKSKTVGRGETRHSSSGETPLWETSLTKPLVLRFANRGIRTVEQLSDMLDADILAIPHVGNHTLRKIRLVAPYSSK